MSALGAKRKEPMDKPRWTRSTHTGSPLNPCRFHYTKLEFQFAAIWPSLIESFIVAAMAEDQNPQSLYCLSTSRKREFTATKSTSRHRFPRRYSPKPLHRRYSRFIRQSFSRGE